MRWFIYWLQVKRYRMITLPVIAAVFSGSAKNLRATLPVLDVPNPCLGKSTRNPISSMNCCWITCFLLCIFPFGTSPQTWKEIKHGIMKSSSLWFTCNKIWLTLQDFVSRRYDICNKHSINRIWAWSVDSPNRAFSVQTFAFITASNRSRSFKRDIVVLHI